MYIIKASGEKEKFNKVKLYQSLKRAGVKPKLAEKVCKTVAKGIRPGMSSWKILNQTTKCLQGENSILAAKYNLKRAIMKLGPTGFPFEKYISGILKEYGYTTEVGTIVKGNCISHEIDVIARKGKEHFMIECKYHNSRGTRSDVKVALYIYARFLDVQCVWKKMPGHKHSREQNNFVLGRAHKICAPIFHQAWLVTNTKCTSEAIRYARCIGLKVVSWRYPKNESLEYLIEKRGLYPITILPSLTRYAKEMLAKKRIMLAKDLLKYSISDLVRRVGLQQENARKLQEEAKQLCICPVEKFQKGVF